MSSNHFDFVLKNALKPKTSESEIIIPNGFSEFKIGSYLKRFENSLINEENNINATKILEIIEKKHKEIPSLNEHELINLESQIESTLAQVNSFDKWVIGDKEKKKIHTTLVEMYDKIENEALYNCNTIEPSTLREMKLHNFLIKELKFEGSVEKII